MTTVINIPVNEIYKSRNNVLSHMKEQGYNISEYENFGVNEVNIMKENDQLDMLLEKSVNNKKTDNKNPGNKEKDNKNNDSLNPQTQKTYIKYYLGKSLRPNNIDEMIDDLFTIEEMLTKNDTLYIIVKDEMNDTIETHLKHVWDTMNIFIIVENIKRLQFNIQQNALVHKHVILTPDETDDIMTEYNIKDKSQLPEISRFDPVARSIGIRPGMICKILRPSKSAIEATYYRVCV